MSSDRSTASEPARKTDRIACENSPAIKTDRTAHENSPAIDEEARSTCEQPDFHASNDPNAQCNQTPTVVPEILPTENEQRRAQKAKGAAQMAAGSVLAAAGIPMLILPGPGAAALIGGAALISKGNRNFTGREATSAEENLDAAAAKAAEVTKETAKKAAEKAADAVSSKVPVAVKQTAGDVAHAVAPTAKQVAYTVAPAAKQVARTVAPAAKRVAHDAASVAAAAAPLAKKAAAELEKMLDITPERIAEIDRDTEPGILHGIAKETVTGAGRPPLFDKRMR